MKQSVVFSLLLLTTLSEISCMWYVDRNSEGDGVKGFKSCDGVTNKREKEICKCDRGTFYMVNQHSTVTCYNDTKIQTATGCQIIYNIKSPSTLVGASNECIIQNIEAWDINGTTVTWRNDFYYTLSQYFIKGNNTLKVVTNQQDFDGLLLRVWLDCSTWHPCYLFKFHGVRTHPLYGDIIPFKVATTSTTTKTTLTTTKTTTTTASAATITTTTTTTKAKNITDTNNTTTAVIAGVVSGLVVLIIICLAILWRKKQRIKMLYKKDLRFKHKESLNDGYDVPSLNNRENTNDGYNVGTMDNGKNNLGQGGIKPSGNIENPYSYAYDAKDNVLTMTPNKNDYTYAYSLQTNEIKQDETKISNDHLKEDNMKIEDKEALNEKVYSEVNQSIVNDYMGKQKADYYSPAIIQHDNMETKILPEYAQVNKKNTK